MMAEAQDDDDEVFVYMGGNQQVPHRVRRAKIHQFVKIVRKRAFQNRTSLLSVELHDGVEIIEEAAFSCCQSLSCIKLPGVKIVKEYAFWCCDGLADVEFGDNLQTIEQHAFNSCTALRSIRIPSVRTIGESAFTNCSELNDVELGEELRTLEKCALSRCPKLTRIALPLKGNMLRGGVFIFCPLTTIDLVGGIHQTVASLHMESWRDEMLGEINLINQTLPTITSGKTEAIQQWMESVISRLDNYKAEHKAILKEATTLLELALWKANLSDNNGREGEREGVRTVERARKEMPVTSGADVVIKNVVPFLKLE